MNVLARYIRQISKFFLRDNYIVSAAAGLGFCSALAVTNKIENSLTMGMGVVFVTCVSFCLVYPFKKLIIASGTHHKVTLLMIIVSVFVTVFNLIAQAIIPRIAFNIQAYIDLITTNCIVLAVISEGLTFEFWDAQKKILKACLGYSIALIFLSLMREPLGFGTLMNFQILPERFPVERTSGIRNTDEFPDTSGTLSCSGIDDNACGGVLCPGIMEVHAQAAICQNGCCLSGKFTKRRACGC